jgi:hypothetical protein
VRMMVFFNPAKFLKPRAKFAEYSNALLINVCEPMTSVN